VSSGHSKWPRPRRDGRRPERVAHDGSLSARDRRAVEPRRSNPGNWRQRTLAQTSFVPFDPASVEGRALVDAGEEPLATFRRHNLSNHAPARRRFEDSAWEHPHEHAGSSASTPSAVDVVGRPATSIAFGRGGTVLWGPRGRPRRRRLARLLAGLRSGGQVDRAGRIATRPDLTLSRASGGVRGSVTWSALDELPGRRRGCDAGKACMRARHDRSRGYAADQRAIPFRLTAIVGSVATIGALLCDLQLPPSLRVSGFSGLARRGCSLHLGVSQRVRQPASFDAGEVDSVDDSVGARAERVFSGGTCRRRISARRRKCLLRSHPKSVSRRTLPSRASRSSWFVAKPSWCAAVVGRRINRGRSRRPGPLSVAGSVVARAWSSVVLVVVGRRPCLVVWSSRVLRSARPGFMACPITYTDSPSLTIVGKVVGDVHRNAHTTPWEPGLRPGTDGRAVARRCHHRSSTGFHILPSLPSSHPRLQRLESESVRRE